MSDIVEQLRESQEELGSQDQVILIDASVLWRAADEIERLRTALRNITDHFASVMGGPMIKGAGIEFENGVEGIPTIAAARALLKDM